MISRLVTTNKFKLTHAYKHNEWAVIDKLGHMESQISISIMVTH